MSFAAAARRAAGLAGALLGWRPDEFWRATPEELAAILEALTGDGAQATADRDLLHDMMERFPDG